MHQDLCFCFPKQKYMYDNHTHTVKDRTVNISQPFIRPVVRGKAKDPVEFGAKLDMSLDESGMVRLERISFDAYNECETLQGAVKRYCERTGRYPERVLVDKTYRKQREPEVLQGAGDKIIGTDTWETEDRKADKKIEVKDNKDRIEEERAFSLAKRNYGLGFLKTKLDTTTRSSIALSVIAMNVEQISRTFLQLFSEQIIWKIRQCILALTDKNNKLLAELATC